METFITYFKHDNILDILVCFIISIFLLPRAEKGGRRRGCINLCCFVTKTRNRFFLDESEKQCDLVKEAFID
jgi:hypothetical protein